MGVQGGMTSLSPLMPNKRHGTHGTGGGMTQKDIRKENTEKFKGERRMGRAHDMKWVKRAG